MQFKLDIQTVLGQFWCLVWFENSYFCIWITFEPAFQNKDLYNPGFGVLYETESKNHVQYMPIPNAKISSNLFCLPVLRREKKVCLKFPTKCIF